MRWRHDEGNPPGQGKGLDETGLYCLVDQTVTSDKATVVRPFWPRYYQELHVSEIVGDKQRTNRRQQMGHNGTERLFGRMVGRAIILKHFIDEGDEVYVKDTRVLCVCP